MTVPTEGPPAEQALDPLLAPFLEAASDAAAEELLAHLLQGTAEPLTRKIVRSRVRAADNDEAEDVSSEVMLHLVARLRALRLRREGQGIADFKSYVAVASYNACHDHLRSRYPLRARLKSRLRYLLSHQPGFASWDGPGDQALCGFAEWRTTGNRALPRALDRLREDPRGLLASVADRPLPDLVAALLDRVGGAIELEDLVDALARILDIYDARVGEIAEADGAVPATSAAQDPLARMDAGRAMKRLWDEIASLPLRQRAALLLNLRDPEGRDVIALFPLSGTVSVREIALALEFPVERFAALWPDLPLEDLAIASLLGVTRQQVINLRKCARERLGRRLRSTSVASALGR